MNALAAESAPLHRYARPATLDAALRLLAADTQAAALAGGTDLVPLARARLRHATTLVDIGRLPLSGVRRVGDTLVLGATTSAQEAAAHPLVLGHAPLIAEALRAGASVQIRNRATLAGNLLQAPRCPWFRSGSPGCNRRQAGSGCDARSAGSHEGGRWLAIFDASAECAAVAPSDLAVALLALQTRVELRSLHGTRSVPLEALWCDGRLRPGVPGAPALTAGELIVALQLPLAEAASRRAVFCKVRDRASFEFALVSVAIQLLLDERDHIVQATVGAGGVAAVPRRLPAVEAALQGQALSALQPAGLAACAADGAMALPGNGFKLPLLVRTVQQALTELKEGR